MSDSSSNTSTSRGHWLLDEATPAQPDSFWGQHDGENWRIYRQQNRWWAWNEGMEAGTFISEVEAAEWLADQNAWVQNAQQPAGDATGFTVAPERYAAQGRETIDRIRDELGDEGFRAFCVGNAMKYEDRAGKKRDRARDILWRILAVLADDAMAPLRARLRHQFPDIKNFVTPDDPKARDMEKARWYRQMVAHLDGKAEDPRSGREGFVPYLRPVSVKAHEISGYLEKAVWRPWGFTLSGVALCCIFERWVRTGEWSVDQLPHPGNYSAGFVRNQWARGGEQQTLATVRKQCRRLGLASYRDRQYTVTPLGLAVLQLRFQRPSDATGCPGWAPKADA